MSATEPLMRSALIDCAKSNAKFGLATAAKHCGYGEEIEQFQAALRSACKDMGVEPQSLNDLMVLEAKQGHSSGADFGIEVGPDSPDSL
ncbi:MAG: hypothetical protein AAGF66_09445 [Cyanobacteria bacterium P01_H01_bin.119]